ncbi:MAG: TonB-dependent receptor [Bacteroidota bacterium]
MKSIRFLPILIILTSLLRVNAQNIMIFGEISDENGDPLFGANIYWLNSLEGQVTDLNGNFAISSYRKPPYVLVISYVGYETIQDTIKTTGSFKRDYQLKEVILLGQEVIVSASLQEESILHSSVTVQKLGIKDIEKMPQASFYDGLAQLREVDLNTQSMTFKVPNTRGFNSNTNYRFNQIIDGVNNQAPGLNFAAGNLFGLPELDVESIELLNGASSALYGAGGMNGTLLIESKDPFDYQGLSASLQLGALNFDGGGDGTFDSYQSVDWRYAKALSEKFAFKFTGSALSSQDWVASDTRDKTAINDPNSNRWTNPGYDGVNVYGDETSLPLSQPGFAEGIARASLAGQGITPDNPEYDEILNTIINDFSDESLTRTGFSESSLVNYDVNNLKVSLAGHYKINKNTTAMLAGTYAEGQAVYSAQNRFSIDDFKIYNLKGEIENEDFLVRYWYVEEDAGLTYDAGGTASLINESWKPTEQWYGDYFTNYYTARIIGGLSEEQSHIEARTAADNRQPNGAIRDGDAPSIPVEGSPEFNALRDSIARLSISEGGGRVLDFSASGQVEARYNFSRWLNGKDVIIGFQHRHYRVDSDGTIFFDEPGDPIRIKQYAVYGQYTDSFMNDNLRINISARWDKDTRLNEEVTPRFSLSYSLGKEKEQTIRFSAQTAFRYPSISDQWVDLFTGAYTVVGGQKEVQEQYGFNSTPTYGLTGNDPIFSTPDTTDLSNTIHIPTLKNERVFALEIGYRGLLLNDRLYLDANIYRNLYDRFQGSQLLYQLPDPEDPTDTTGVRYQTFVTTDTDIINWGWSLGLDYSLPNNYTIGGNVAYSTIENTENLDESFQTNFNTPRYRFNLKFGNRKLTNRTGFTINYHWQERFLWESTFGVGKIPAYGSLDAAVTYSLPNIKSKLIVGGSNILNEYYTSSFGSSSIGGLYYVKFVYDQFFR